MAAWWKFWTKDEVEVLDENGKKVKGGTPRAIIMLNARVTKLEEAIVELKAPKVITTAKHRKKK